MTRTRAWALSIIATASLLALVVGVGASTGQFGFKHGGTDASAEGLSPKILPIAPLVTALM